MISIEKLFGKIENEPNQKILKVISRNGVNDIICSLNRSPKRFSQLMFETKLNPGILDRHLKALIELKIIEKNSETYELTDSGRKLLSILEELFKIFK